MRVAFFFKTLEAYDAHIAPIIINAPQNSCVFSVFHINRIYAPHYHNDSIHCELLDFSKKWNIIKNIKAFNPDIMVLYNPGHIYELFLTDICKQLGITTVFFQHGLSIDLSSIDIRSLNQNKSISQKFLSLKKYSFYLISISVNLFFIKKRSQVLKHLLLKCNHLLTYIFRKNVFHKLPKYGLKEVHCDFAFVYGIEIMSYLSDSMGMDPKKIVISGYPFLSPTIEKQPLTKSGRVLFLSNPYRATGMLPISIEDERLFYHSLYDQVLKAGFELNIKLHPKDSLPMIKSYFDKFENVGIYQNKNLADLTISSILVISDFSTALFYAIKFKKPIIILTSRFFKRYPFEYTDHGIGFKSNLENLYKSIGYAIQHIHEQENAYAQFASEFLYSNYDQDTYTIFYTYLNKLIKQKNKHANE